jgi:hypothetical protein
MCGRRCADWVTHKADTEIIVCICETLYSLPNRGSTSFSKFLSSNRDLACLKQPSGRRLINKIRETDLTKMKDLLH